MPDDEVEIEWDEVEEDDPPDVFGGDPRPVYGGQPVPEPVGQVMRRRIYLDHLNQHRAPAEGDPAYYEPNYVAEAIFHGGNQHQDWNAPVVSVEQAEENGLLRIMESKCDTCPPWVIMCEHFEDGRVCLLHTTQWSSAELNPQTFYICQRDMKGRELTYHHDDDSNWCQSTWDRMGYEGAVAAFRNAAVSMHEAAQMAPPTVSRFADARAMMENIIQDNANVLRDMAQRERPQ